MELWEIIWKSFLLGTVQGLTEFLPVSSSGHLVLLQRLLGYRLEGGSMTSVNIALHFGTLIAVILAFRREIAALFRPPFRKLGLLIAATLPAALAGFFLEEEIDALFAGEYGIPLLAVCFGLTAVMLLACELVATRRKRSRPLGCRSALSMGAVQAVAILPGISRSGSTIAAGVMAGGDVGEVSSFSFLMSIPIILGSSALGLLKGGFGQIGFGGAVGVCVGILSSAGFGLLALRLMKLAVGKANYKWFALYLLLLALASAWMYALGIL